MILDVKVCLDNHTLINLEMQLAKQDFGRNVRWDIFAGPLIILRKGKPI